MLLGTLIVSPARAQLTHTFPSGSLIVPMDLAYQDTGMLQAYGLVFALLSHEITVYWVIDEDKTWHDAACNAVGDECAWECAGPGSGPCSYPTASPDFTAAVRVVWDGDGTLDPGDLIASHAYRGGPFVVDAEDAEAARAIVDAWNDPNQWAANPWAQRTVFHVVSVHETTAEFVGNVRKRMIRAPTIAVFSDGNEHIATSYLRAAGIPQSNGSEFPMDRCEAGLCGPGTANPDMLTVQSIMGDMGTCEAPNFDHRNGALFTSDGSPAYCQIMSMHWDVRDRETVQCDDGACPATQAECDGEVFTYHGHEVVAEVRQFLSFPTHFFAECQAVNAYENTVPNPAWPFLDDEHRRGHFLTTIGTPPDCPCTGAAGFACVVGGCDNGARDCCLPTDLRERGAGFLIADQPNSDDVRVLNASVPYNQLDGAFETTGGSEPAYNLSTYLGTQYINDLDVTFITGPAGPGDQDIWMTGFVDGECDINEWDEFRRPGECQIGKVSYLGGHDYDTAVPISDHGGTQGTRLFLNALFEADCVTGALEGTPAVSLTWAGARVVPSDPLPVEQAYSVTYRSTGDLAAADAVLSITLPAGLEITTMDPGGTRAGDVIQWDLGTLDPAATGTRGFTARFTAEGTYPFDAVVTFDGTRETRAAYTVRVVADRDGDGSPDDDDEFPDDPRRCGDTDADSCDDCTSGAFNPAADCDRDGDGAPDGLDEFPDDPDRCGDSDTDTCDDCASGTFDLAQDCAITDGGCGCRAVASRRAAPFALWLVALGLLIRRRR